MLEKQDSSHAKKKFIICLDYYLLGQPFKVAQQYHNFIGKEVEVLTADGKKVKGILKAVDGRDFTVEVKEKVKVEGKKRPELQDVEHQYNMDEVKYTKYLISFK